MDFDFLPLVVVGIAAGITGLVLYARPQMVLGRGIWAISSVLILWLAYALRRLFLLLVRRGLFLKQAMLLCDHPDRAADMLRLQQAYQAASQLISTADNMFQTILGAVSR